MMEAMYEADEARQLEEDRARLLSYVGESENYEKESKREMDDCLGTYDTVSSDVRAVGDGPYGRK